MGKVGRFQVMATLQAARAQELGLAPDEAKSWGLNRAVFYAVAKRGFRNAGGVTTSRQDRGAATGDEHRADRGNQEYVLGGEKAYLGRGRGPALRFAI